MADSQAAARTAPLVADFEQQRFYADQLRQERLRAKTNQQGVMTGITEAATEDEEGAEEGRYMIDTAGALRQAKRRLKNKPSAVEKLSDSLENAAQAGPSAALRSSWRFLIGSWGLTLIWINIHAFLSLVLSKVFCKLGHEWIPTKIPMPKEEREAAGDKIGLLEKMGLVTLDLAVLFILLLIGVAIYLTVMLVKYSFNIPTTLLKWNLGW